MKLKRNCVKNVADKYLPSVSESTRRHRLAFTASLLMHCGKMNGLFAIALARHLFGGVRRQVTALLWLVRGCSHRHWSDTSSCWGCRLETATAALRWWGRLIGKNKMCICKVKEAADSYTNKVIMALVLRPNAAEAPGGSDQKFILIIMWILH